MQNPDHKSRHATTLLPPALTHAVSALLLAWTMGAAAPGNAAAIVDENASTTANHNLTSGSDVLPEPEPTPEPERKPVGSEPVVTEPAAAVPAEPEPAVLEPAQAEPAEPEPAEPESAVPEPVTPEPAEPEPAEQEQEVESTPHLALLNEKVPPGTYTRLAWAPTQSFEGIYIATPVLVANGAEPGPTLCITAALHGDELNGIETVRRVLYNLDPAKLRGAVIGVPIVNLQGFHSGSRYLADRRDLNRYFPGDPDGSSASRIAHSFFNEIIQHCSAVVDLHTGSFNRTNLPQLRGDLSNPKVVQLTKGFGSTVVLHSDGSNGTLRRSAVEFGIPAVTLEAGGPSVLDEDSVYHSVKGIRTLLNHLDMTSRFSLWGDPEPVYYNSVWQRAPVGGIVFSRVALGQNVKEGELLATITNPITNVRTRIISSYNGRIIGMALNQVVQPGFATHHIGIAPPKDQISDPEEVTVLEAPVADGEADEELAETGEDEEATHGED